LHSVKRQRRSSVRLLNRLEATDQPALLPALGVQLLALLPAFVKLLAALVRQVPLRGVARLRLECVMPEVKWHVGKCVRRVL
jgi:hypothetical protein